MLGFVLSIPGLLGLAYAVSFWQLSVSALVLGFFLLSASPVGMQYAAEITHPTLEGTSAGLIQLFGQASVVIVYVMEALRAKDGSFTPALLLAVALMVLSVLVIARLHEPVVLGTAGDAMPQGPGA